MATEQHKIIVEQNKATARLDLLSARQNALSMFHKNLNTFRDLDTSAKHWTPEVNIDLEVPLGSRGRHSRVIPGYPPCPMGKRKGYEPLFLPPLPKDNVKQWTRLSLSIASPCRSTSVSHLPWLWLHTRALKKFAASQLKSRGNRRHPGRYIIIVEKKAVIWNKLILHVDFSRIKNGSLLFAS